MKKGVVIIPCWRRPEFLGACLHYIRQADGWDDYAYLFAVDNHRATTARFDPQVLKVIERFPGEKVLKIRNPHDFHGNSYNVLEAYREAMEMDIPGLIFLIETDIFIGKDFFTFHEAAHEIDSDTFYVSACRNQNNKQAGSLPADPEAVYYWNRYQSLGNSFKPITLATYVLQHCTPEYYGNMHPYCKRHFPLSEFGRSLPPWWEQDGLINRIMEKDNLQGIFPFAPRAYHAGYEGYNRKGESLPSGMVLEDKISAILSMTEDEMNRRAMNPQFKDITKCNLEGYEAKKLKVMSNAELHRTASLRD